MLELDTHDVCEGNHRLEAGNLLTIEPDLYVREENIDIPIEDDILVTKDGRINLSIDIMKQTTEIEAFMQKAKEDYE